MKGTISMTIYSLTNKRDTIYRKIWETHFGEIPKDEDGRTYEIHHIDGNKHNNDIQNLACVSIQEHYDIHKKQTDWSACYAIKIRMKHSPEELSRLASLRERDKLDKGIHVFQRIDLRQNNLDRISDGTHNFLGPESNQKRIDNGTHNFLGSTMMKELYESGRHATQTKLSCVFCRKESSLHSFSRLHGDNCDCNPESPKYKMNVSYRVTRWWNNGTDEVQSKTCPGIDWEMGSITDKSYGRPSPPSHIGKKRWHKGDLETVAFECPGPGWIRGGKSRKSK